MTSDLVGTTEAAGILGVSARTVKRYAKAGRILVPATKMFGDTGAYVFHRADIERLAAARAAEQVAL